MPLSSINVVPELQDSINTFITESIVNRNGAPSSIGLDSVYLEPKSFLKLLFSNDFSETSYLYLYESESNKLCWPRKVLERIMIYPNSARYYIHDSTGTNLFTLQQDDLTLLDSLLAYRLDSTSVIIVDSTANTFVNPTLETSVTSLSTNLSKLIFLYLDLKINENYQNYNDTTLLSGETSLLEIAYETYVVDEMFNFISNRGT